MHIMHKRYRYRLVLREEKGTYTRVPYFVCIQDTPHGHHNWQKNRMPSRRKMYVHYQLTAVPHSRHSPLLPFRSVQLAQLHLDI